MRGVRTGYGLAYRVGFTPWEHYGRIAASTIGALLDREEAGRPHPPGRALDLGCGRGQKTHELARRGWDAVGIDTAVHAIEESGRDAPSGARFVVGDVTALPADLGRFDFFLDVGCFQHLDLAERTAMGRGVTALANPGATLLMLEFGATRLRSFVGGVTRADIQSAFPGWRLLSAEPASTAGLGWPMSRTAPQWFRFGLAS
ncbi:class I SAM-dependent methyltransferase [Cellulomonas sp. Leaf395]|uniref:class I SAM-dependent methyltransferase n=1 Tax=Cellulomonas sp. Leaf395 TaxID=1736362 RepID=UPI0006F709A0|nr:class I SAM-dependent methyltransferase [Cellulomonas sp. Leaf395]KQT02363.1 methyltransferase type 11 [Cellulomonas sp. Leaf395]